MTRAERTTASTPRSTGVVPSQASVAGVIRRDRVVITSCIVLITALAWAWLVHLHSQMSSPVVPETLMANMGMVITASWGASDVFYTFLMWAVMMIGMMSVTAAPVLVLFSGMQARRREQGPSFTVLLVRARLHHCLAGIQCMRCVRTVGIARGCIAVIGHGRVELASRRSNSHRGGHLPAHAVEGRMSETMPESARFLAEQLA